MATTDMEGPPHEGKANRNKRKPRPRNVDGTLTSTPRADGAIFRTTGLYLGMEAKTVGVSETINQPEADTDWLKDEMVEEYIETKRADVPDVRVWRSLREQFRTQILYPGRYVAYIDTWETFEENQYLVQRHVIADTATLNELQEIINLLPANERSLVDIDYIATRD